MLKRLREDVDESTSDATRNEPSTIQRELLARQGIDHGHTVILKALKIARGFERQKLSRRLKTATSSNDTLSKTRIEQEITAAKTLDLSNVATNFLVKSLLKFKAVAASPSLPGFFRRLAPLPKEAEALNVVGRLCGSAPVKEVLPGVLKDVQIALGVYDPQKGEKPKRLRAKDHAEMAARQSDDLGVGDIASANSNGQVGTDEPNALEDDEEEFQGFDDRLGGTSDDQGSAFEDDDDDLNTRLAAIRASLSTTHKPSTDLSLSEGDSSDDDAFEETPEVQKGTSMKRRRISSPSPSISRSPSPAPTSHDHPASPPRSSHHPTSSAFLPSLTMGGYISGGDSDGSEDIDTQASSHLLHKSSNRRGQRARRAIWEQKYGAAAKHVAGGEKDQNKGWDPKRGATDGRYGQRRAAEARTGAARRGAGESGGAGAGVTGNGETRPNRAARRGNGGGKPSTGPKPKSKGTPGQVFSAGAAPAKKRVKDDEGPLHPSWEAAKRAKETKNKVIAPYQGQRVTFD